MLEKIADINWLAVLVAAVISFFLGAIWYMPLFGKLWVSLHGYSEVQLEEMKAKMKPPVFFGGIIASYFVAAIAMALLIVTFDLKQVRQGIELAVAVWLVVAAAAMTAHLASQKRLGIFLIDAAFYLVFILVTSIVLTLWR